MTRTQETYERVYGAIITHSGITATAIASMLGMRANYVSSVCSTLYLKEQLLARMKSGKSYRYWAKDAAPIGAFVYQPEPDPKPAATPPSVLNDALKLRIKQLELKSAKYREQIEVHRLEVDALKDKWKTAERNIASARDLLDGGAE